MNRDDRNKLIIIGYVIGFIGAVVLFFVLGNMVPGLLVAGLLCLFEVFFVIPQCVVGYYKTKGAKAPSVGRFIPIYNETLVFKPAIAICCMAGIALTIVVCATAFVPIEFLMNFMSEHNAVNYSVVAINITIVLALVVNVLFGAGWIGVMHDVQGMYTERFHVDMYKKSTLLWYDVLLLLPIIRYIPVTQMLNALNKLTVFNEYEKKDVVLEKEVL